MGAWGKDQKADGKVHDAGRRQWRLHHARSGSSMDGSGYGMGKRSQRYAMVVDNGVVKALNVEKPGGFEVSSAEAMLKAL